MSEPVEAQFIPAQEAGPQPPPNGLVELRNSTATDPAPLSLIHQAIEKGITDPGYLEKLLALQERWEDRQAAMAFNVAMNACQKEIPPIKKNKENVHNKSQYADLEQVLACVQPIYIRHGFSVSFGEEACEIPDTLRLRADVRHVAGHTENYWGHFPYDGAGSAGKTNKTAIQAAGSAFSYGRRYLLGTIFNLSFTQDDNDGQPTRAQQTAQRRAYQPKVVTLAQVKEIHDLLAECKDAGRPVEEAKLLQWMKVSKVDDIPQEDLGEVLRILNQKRRGER
jgi:hypothetical protein